MVDTIFLKILDMSSAASLAIAVILLARLCLRRVPKVITYALWAVVLFRLLCPVTVESAVSILPEMESVARDYTLADDPITVIGASEAAYRAVGDVLNGGVDVQHIRTTERNENGNVGYATATWREVWLLFGSYVWLAGIAVMVIRATVQTVRLRRRLVGAVPMGKGVFLADYIDSPFVMGLIRPKIYLPSSLDAHEREYILLHERHHIRRGDHITRALGFVALCLHWFNPLVWIAFILSGRDMEMSCDEAVVRRLGGEIRADYAASLLRLTTGRRAIAPTPLAFGEGNTGGRIRNLSKWKKPLLIVVVIATIVCVVLAVCLLTDPITEKQDVLAGSVYRLEESLTDGTYTMVGTDEKNAREHDRLMNSLQNILLTADMHLYLQFEDTTEYWGALEPYELSVRMRELIGERVVDAYIARREDQRFLLFAQTKKGETLCVYGWEDVSEWDDVDSDDTTLYAMWRLESVFDEEYDKSEFFGQSLIRSVGRDYACLNVIGIAEMPDYAIVGFAASLSDPENMTDMGYAVFRAYGKEGYRLMNCRVYPDAVTDGIGIYIADPAVLDERGHMTDKNTYDVILSANKELEKIVRHGKDPGEGIVAVIDAPFSMTVFSWRDFAKDKTVSTVFYNRNGEKMVVDMPARISAFKIDDNATLGCVVVPEDGARSLLTYMENAPWVELTHPVYENGTTFQSGYIIRVEYVIRDEYVLHDDMVDCFIWEYNGEYFLDGYKNPENGKHIQRIDAECYRVLNEYVNNLLRWETENLATYLSTFERSLSYLPESITLYRYIYGKCTQRITLTDRDTVTWLAYALLNPSYMRAYTSFEASDAMQNKKQNGVQLCFDYGMEAPTSSIECWVVCHNEEWYMDGYDYPNDTRDRPLEVNEARWNRLMELLK